MSVNDMFRRFSQRASKVVGSSWAFIGAGLFIVVWAVSAWEGHFSEGWLISVSTLCTIITFLIVFLIQNTQNRHNRAMQLKLDELIKAHGGARNELVALEEMSDEDIDALQDDFHILRQEFVDRQAAIIKQHLARKRTQK